MYTVVKRIEVSGAHSLSLDYESQCCNIHGHNWIIEVTLQAPCLNANGMIVDFSEIKDVVMELDHANLNEVLEGVNPTAENIAKWVCDGVPHCVRVKVQETEGNVAIYER